MTRHVLLTRPAERSEALARRLEAADRRVTVAPAIRIATLEHGASVAAAALDRADRVLFTSANAVRALAAASSHRPEAWCVGRATAAAARGAGHAVEHEGAAGVAELIEAIGAVPGLAVVWPCGNLSKDSDAAPLRDAGASVLAIPVYATASAYQDGAAPAVADVDDVVFASPSAVLFLLEALGESAGTELRDRARAIAIGGTTLRALNEADWRLVVRSPSTDDDGLLAALMAS